MPRSDLADLAAFATVAEERSFVRAAARLGVSASAVSHGLRGLEERLGVKLLHRTTRSVALTEAGRRLLERLRPALGEIDDAVGDLSQYRDRPAGRVRISSHHWAAEDLIAPRLAALREAYPEVVVELSIEDGLTDIVTAGFDAGVRPGEVVARDMVAVRIGPDQRTAVVAAPSYFERHPRPLAPEDLKAHRCVLYRGVTSGRPSPWAFAKDGRAVSVAVEPAFVTDSVEMLVRSALDGVGMAYVLADPVGPHLASGALVRVLEDWSTTLEGNFLYYPSRRQMTPALRVVVDALRLR